MDTDSGTFGLQGERTQKRGIPQEKKIRCPPGTTYNRAEHISVNLGFHGLGVDGPGSEKKLRIIRIKTLSIRGSKVRVMVRVREQFGTARGNQPS